MTAARVMLINIIPSAAGQGTTAATILVSDIDVVLVPLEAETP